MKRIEKKKNKKKPIEKFLKYQFLYVKTKHRLNYVTTKKKHTNVWTI